MTRDELVDLVVSYSKRPDLETEIETMFIPIGEARIGRDLKSAENETFVEIVVSDGSAIPYPDDYGQVRAIDVAENRGPFTLRSVDLHTINRWARDQSGSPRVYAAANSEFIMQPSQDGTFTLYYWSRPKLTDGDDSNAVLDRWPQLYLYAVLVELHIWEKDTEGAQGAISVYEQEYKRINHDSARALGDKPAMRRV